MSVRDKYWGINIIKEDNEKCWKPWWSSLIEVLPSLKQNKKAGWFAVRATVLLFYSA